METPKQQIAKEEPKSSPNLPPDRLSYLECNQVIVPPDFDENVILNLSPEFKVIAQEDHVPLEHPPPGPEPLKTYLRIRPYDKKSDDEIDIIEVKDEETIVASALIPSNTGQGKICRKTEYKFTKVLDASCSQQQVYETVVSPLMERFERGENCLVFSYGATNSGKTFTMQGTSAKYGIIPRTLDYIFNRYQEKIYTNADIKPASHESFKALSPDESQAILDRKKQLLDDAAKTNDMKCRQSSSSVSSPPFSLSQTSSHCGSLAYIPGEPGADSSNRSYGSCVYSMWVSFVELHNEKCYDLLDTASSNVKGKRKFLKVVNDKSGNSIIQDLTEIPVYNEEEAFGIYVAGRKRLQVGKTGINQCSSRSHCFFTIRVVELGVNNGSVFPVHMYRMSFCDLAGMERVSQTENTGEQLKESANINNSLLSLLKVIRMIREKQMCSTTNGQSFLEKIPFRDSQLTRIFRGYFTSSTHIVMIVNVNPSPKMLESSTVTLKSSAIARNIIAFRQPHTAKLMAEDSRVNSSFLHSSRDMEDIMEEDEGSEANEKPNRNAAKKAVLKQKTLYNRPSFKARKPQTKKKFGGSIKSNNSHSFKSTKASHRKMAESVPIDEFSEDSDCDKENEQTSGSIASMHYYLDRILQVEHENSNLINERDAYIELSEALKKQNRECKQKYSELYEKFEQAQKKWQVNQKSLRQKLAEKDAEIEMAVENAKEEVTRLFTKRMESQDKALREANERIQKLLLANNRNNN